MKKALIIVDFQNDFNPGGALGVPNGDRIAPNLNKLIKHFLSQGYLVIYTRDWHTEENNVHFAKWPVHCVQDTQGAAFHNALDVVPEGIIISKGMKNDADCYGPYEDGKVIETGETLLEVLDKFSIEEIFVTGLATDYCVKTTAIESKEIAGRDVYVVSDAIAGVEINEGDCDTAVQEMKQKNVTLMTTDEVVSKI